jgi:D-alanyl-D-alanine carboxypeptidase
MQTLSSFVTSCVFCLASASWSTVMATPLTALSGAGADKVDALVTETLHREGAPGAVVAIVSGGAVLYRKAYGTADLASGRALDPDTAFEIGSLTKQMTAVAILQLVAAHRIALTDRVDQFVPGHRAAAAVTVAQLLQQVSGIPDFAASPVFAAGATSQPIDFAHLLGTVDAQPLDFAPGKRWKYSNTNYLLLGHLVELVSKTSFDSYLAQHVLAPAAMRSVTTLGAKERYANQARGYMGDGPRVVAADSFENSWIGAAGNLVATVDDLIAWDRFLFGGAGQPFLPMMATPAVLADGTTVGYGFGLFVDRQAGHRRIWHGGGTLGFSSSNMVYPDEALWIIALVNDGDVNATALTAALYDALHGIERSAAPGEVPAVTASVALWLQRLQRGELLESAVAPALFTSLTANAHQALDALKAQLDIYGRPETILYQGRVNDSYAYIVRFGAQWLHVDCRFLDDARLSSIAITPE